MKENQIPAGSNKKKGVSEGVKEMAMVKHLVAGIKVLVQDLDIRFVQVLRVDRCHCLGSFHRGFKRTRFQNNCATVNLYDFEKINGDKVDLNSLKEAGLIRPNSTSVKILGTGEINKAYTVDILNLSKSARQKIESAGGTISE